jgi:hypothetical protein
VPSESDLRDLLRGSEPEGLASIDLDAVLTRARRRRRPKVVAAQALGSVALVGVLVTAIGFSLPRTGDSAALSAQDTAAGSEEATAPFVDEDAAKWTPDVCGAPVTDRPASTTLVAEITLPTMIEPSETVPVTVTLRNDGPDRVVGSTGSTPYLVFSQAGTVLWHSYAVQDLSARLVDLAPGQSMSYDAFFERTVCGSEDDLVMDDPESALPLAGPGSYELRAVIVVSSEDGSGFVVSTPALPIEITE